MGLALHHQPAQVSVHPRARTQLSVTGFPFYRGGKLSHRELVTAFQSHTVGEWQSRYLRFPGRWGSPGDWGPVRHMGTPGKKKDILDGGGVSVAKSCPTL